MTLSRLITWMSGVSEIAIRALRPVERMRLAHECLRLLKACDVAPKVSPPALPPPPKSGVLADLREPRSRT